jgi:cytochrome c
MTPVRIGSAIIIALALSTFTANAAQFGTRDEAVAMVKRVQEKFKKDGAEATFAAVTAQQRAFKDRDLYVYIMNFDCVIQAHAARAELVGKSLYDFRDQDGVYPARKTVETARIAGRGWIDYRWTNPQTRLVEAKSTYVEKLGDRYAIGVGIYKDEQVNRNTVSIISGSPGSDATYLQVAYDLAAVLNDGENLRILPVVGVGGSQNIRDVRALKGIDIGLTQVSILNNFRRVNETLGVTDDKIVYVSKLFNLEVHLVGRSNITSIEQLKGQKVNLDELGSGTKLFHA